MACSSTSTRCASARPSCRVWTSWRPAFADLLATREHRFRTKRQGAEITLTDIHETFRKADFAETGVLAQVADKHTCVAIR